MNIETFGVERWMDQYENEAVYNVAETCVDSLTVGELLKMAGNSERALEEILSMRLTYGDIPGSERLRNSIAGLYSILEPSNVLVMNGGSASNFLALYTLVEPGDHVISVNPTYQQLQSIPRSFGAEVEILQLEAEDKFLPDVKRLSAMVRPNTKLICINNPNNPTGSVMSGNLLEEVIEIAGNCGAWIHCDEVYRMLLHEPGKKIPSVCDLYEKGISVGSMSKAFSLAGLRLGWIAANEDFIAECMIRRDYTNISCGMIDDYLASLALENKEELLERNLGIVRQNIEILDRWVNEEPGISYVRPCAGTTAFVGYDYKISSEDLCKRLIEKNGTFLVPGSCFGMDKWFRIGYAFDPRILERGLKGISELLRELETEGPL